jgi:hypothetical protein
MPIKPFRLGRFILPRRNPGGGGRVSWSFTYYKDQKDTSSLFEQPETKTSLNLALCGDGIDYQINLLGLNLLAVPEEGDATYDPLMAEVAHEVNALFRRLAGQALTKKRKELRLAKVNGTVLDRLEVTVLLHERGILPAFSVALPTKERAPKPQKPTHLRLFGWALPSRKATWDMSATSASASTTGRAKPPRLD